MGKKKSDTDRILDELLERPSHQISSYEIRITGLSGNPSQRIKEIEGRGYVIEKELRHNPDGRPFTLYRLEALPPIQTEPMLLGDF